MNARTHALLAVLCGGALVGAFALGVVLGWLGRAVKVEVGW